MDCTLDNEENGCKEHSLFCVRVKKSHCPNEVKCRIRRAVPTNDRPIIKSDGCSCAKPKWQNYRNVCWAASIFCWFIFYFSNVCDLFCKKPQQMKSFFSKRKYLFFISFKPDRCSVVPHKHQLPTYISFHISRIGERLGRLGGGGCEGRKVTSKTARKKKWTGMEWKTEASWLVSLWHFQLWSFTFSSCSKTGR